MQGRAVKAQRWAMSRDYGRNTLRAFGLLLMCVGLAALVAPLAMATGPQMPVKGLPDGLRAPSALPPGISGSTNRGASIVPGRYIVVLEDSVQHPGAVAETQAEQNGSDVGFVYRSVLNGYSVVDLSSEDLASLRRDPRVAYVAPDRKNRLSAQSVPTGIERISATGNPYLDIDGQDDVRINADVAVIDSGIDNTHPDLNVFKRFDCTSEDIFSASCTENSGIDGVGHGTHVAGTIGAIDNDFGVVGVAPGVRLWSFRVFNDFGGGGFDAWIIAAIEKITSQASSIEVVNMSLGGFGKSAPLETAIKASTEKGVVYVVSAGNESSSAATAFPANSPDVITVSALADYDGKPGSAQSPTCTNWGKDDTLASFSNWGAKVDLAAPGVCVYSTLPGNKYGYNSGTSMAAPHVAGTAAAMASIANPNSKADVEAIRRQLVDGGSLQWTDNSADTEAEPLLYYHATPLSKTEVGTAGFAADQVKSATLTGSINARGLTTVYKFEYGPTTAYGQSTPASPKSLSEVAHHTSVSETVSGLVPGQTYHYRLVTINGNGITYGADQVFVAPRWSSQSPASSVVQEWLEDVSCSTSTSCVAVGYRQQTGNVAFQRTASGWSLQSVPSPGDLGTLQTVSCSAPAACTAVGGYYNEGGDYVPWAVRWNGTSWSLQSVPEPGGFFTVIRDVSCRSATECIVVGYTRNPDPESTDFWVNYSARWNGSSWTQLATPNPADSQESELDGISCVSTGSCKAVGWYDSDSGFSKPVIAAWNGTSWSLDTPAGSSGKTLQGVSCTSTTFCIAVGGKPWTEVWDGSKWTGQTNPLPSGSAKFEDVSCVSQTSCVALGHTFSGPRPLALVQTWNGTAWTSQAPVRVPELLDTAVSEFGDVVGVTGGISCRPLSGCAIAGTLWGGVDSAVVDWSLGADSLIEVREDVLTEPATGIQSGGATLNATINPGGLATTYRFEYGKTTSYGTKVPASDESVGSGAGDVAVAKAASGLAPNTTYHYRVAATNANGTVFGKDVEFTTLPTTGTKLEGMPVTEPFDGTPASVARFNADWSPVGWAGGSKPKGEDTASGWRPIDDYPIVNGAFYNAPIVDTGAGIAAVATMAVGPSFSSRYFSLWLDATGSSATRTGYELRFVRANIPANTYEVALSKWQGGVKIALLASKSGYSFASGNSLALVDEGSTVSGWTDTGAGFTELLTASDSSFSSGSAAVEGSGNEIRLTKFKVSSPLAPTYVSALGSKGTGNGQFDTPMGVAVLPFNGNLVVLDHINNTVQEFTPGGQFVRKFGSAGSGNGQFKEPMDIATDWKGNIWVADSGNHRIQQFTESGVFIRSIGSEGSANGQFKWPFGITTDSKGDVWVADTNNNRVQRFNESGVYQSKFSVSGPHGIDIDSKGNVWTSHTGSIQARTAVGALIRSFGEYGSGKGQLASPGGLYIDSNGIVWVADTENHRVQVFSEVGGYLTAFGSQGAGPQQMQYPSALTLDPSGSIWIADPYNSRVDKWKR